MQEITIVSPFISLDDEGQPYVSTQVARVEYEGVFEGLLRHISDYKGIVHIEILGGIKAFPEQ